MHTLRSELQAPDRTTTRDEPRYLPFRSCPEREASSIRVRGACPKHGSLSVHLASFFLHPFSPVAGAPLDMSRYPYGLSPDITPTSTPTKLTKAQKSRARREPSGVFSLFSPPQIQQFREAFSLIDHDGDGIVNEQDLKHIFASLGA